MLLFYYISPRAYHRRVRRIGTVCLVLLAILWGRIAWLQAGQHEQWEERAEERLARSTVLPFRRGTIRDRHGEKLVEDVRSYDLFFVPADLYRESRCGQVWRTLQILGAFDVEDGFSVFWSHRQEAIRRLFDLRALDVLEATNRLGLDRTDRGKVFYYLNRLIDRDLVPDRQRPLRYLREASQDGNPTLLEVFPGAAEATWKAMHREMGALVRLGEQMGDEEPWSAALAMDRVFERIPGRVGERVEDWKARRLDEQREGRDSEAGWVTWLRESILGSTAWSADEIVRLTRQVEEDFLERAYRIRRSVPYDAVTYVSLERAALGGWRIDPALQRRTVPGRADLAPHVIGFLQEIRAASLEEERQQRAIYSEELERLRSGPMDAGDQVWAKELQLAIDRREYGPLSLQGWRGIEESFESRLRGIDGVQIEPRGGGRPVVHPPRDGEDVHLTLDLDLQRACQEVLDQAPTGEHGGAIVVLDVETGDVLALATRPRLTAEEMLEHYAELDAPPFALVDKTRDYYHPPAPGSILKPFLALGALEEGLLRPEDRIRCEHFFYHDGRRYKCEGHHGDIDVVGAIGKSCNVFFYELGRRMADELGSAEAAGARLHHWVARFGFGESTGLEIEEKNGHLAAPRSVAEIIQFVIGQGTVQVTPLQAARAMAGLATRGRLPRARLVHQVGLQPLPVKVEEVPFPGWALEVVRRGMAHTIDQGTARDAFRGDSDIAGKTGSAQVAGKTSHAWFVGEYPRERPRLSLVVYLKNGGGGGSSAAPVAGHLLESEAWKRCVGF
ncbi:MAG: penicillin-binding transpeptidase domain-containing protein [Planctomycetota bacterium]